VGSRTDLDPEGSLVRDCNCKPVFHPVVSHCTLSDVLARGTRSTECKSKTGQKNHVSRCEYSGSLRRDVILDGKWLVVF
jgi:hypothetical protein